MLIQLGIMVITMSMFSMGDLMMDEVQNEVHNLRQLRSLTSFHNFMLTHNKQYDNTTEYKRRYKIFRGNMKKMVMLQRSEQGTARYGVTHLSDLTQEEFKSNYLGFNGDPPDIHWPAAEIPDVDLPEEFDWRDHGAVTPVKNQGMCGSCWAFSVTGNVEGQNAVRNGELLSLSEQELVDCDGLDLGCSGGLMENAYETLMEIGGLETEEDYGYDGADEACQFNRSKVAVRVTGGVEISTNETKMAQWLLKNGPISIALNAFPMQFYMGGVSHPFSFMCSPEELDHGVLIVGFGVHTTRWLHRRQPYWIIKNSWGPYWGEKGYYRLYRGEGVCGVNMYTSSAVVEETTTTTTTTTTTSTTTTSTTTTSTTTTSTTTTSTTTTSTTTTTTTSTTTSTTTTETTTTSTTTTAPTTTATTTTAATTTKTTTPSATTTPSTTTTPTLTLLGKEKETLSIKGRKFIIDNLE